MKRLFSHYLRFIVTGLALLALIVPVSPAAADDDAEITVMTQNLYLGGDISKVVNANKPIPLAVAEIFQTMEANRFDIRAKAIADQIAATRPHVIGLQEVSTYYVQTPSDFHPVYGNMSPATDVFIDFYTVLNAELVKRGLHYKAFSVTNADIEMPMIVINPNEPPSFSDVRLVDHDILLVRQDLPAQPAFAANYLRNLRHPVGGASVEFTRGYVGATVKIEGQKYLFVNTHLEVGGDPEDDSERKSRIIQALQMNELEALLRREKRPVILLGDFNSAPTDNSFDDDPPLLGEIDPPYQQAIDAGYEDTWLLQENPGLGFTFGFGELLNNPDDIKKLKTRIDHIFVDPKKLSIGDVVADVVGDEVSDMIDGLWPSDHAGVVAWIEFDKEDDDD